MCAVGCFDSSAKADVAFAGIRELDHRLSQSQEHAATIALDLDRIATCQVAVSLHRTH